ncbi:MAG: radical SAM protein [Gallionella sp.]|nr:radical SAM protein [Gallionella sp.]
MLSTSDHGRDSASLQYVYPVVSRRAGGVSVGINLNTNNACNWRCVYCQVPGLVNGSAPQIDLNTLEQELRGFLHQLLQGDFMQTRVPEGARRLNDIALSGNGEPTSSGQFAGVIELIAKLRNELSVPAGVKTVLISNGSLMHRAQVQDGLRQLAKINGEIWFKLDRADAAGRAQINDTQVTTAAVRDNLITAISLCPTWLQTCWFTLDGVVPGQSAEDEYVAFVESVINAGHRPQGVLLYGLARPSMQAEAARLGNLDARAMDAFAERLRTLGLQVNIS